VQVKVTPDQKAAQRFHAAMRDIRRISGKDFETVIKSELGAMLKSAVRGTKKATDKSIFNNWQKQPGSQYSFNYSGPETRTGKTYSEAETARLQQRAAQRRASGKNGRLVYYFSGSKQTKLYPNSLWGQIQEQRRASLMNRRKARGLAASMFVKIGDKLGIPVDAPGYVRSAAHHKKGPMAELIDVHSKGSGDKYEVGFVNNLTYMNRWAQAGTAFRKAMNARANYFSKAVKLQAAGTIKRVLDRYPGLATMSGSVSTASASSSQGEQSSGAGAASRSTSTGRRGGVYETRVSASGRTYKKYL